MTKKDRLTISSDEILKKAALEAEKEARRQMGNYCSRARELPDDCEAIDEEFLAFARAYDAKHKKPPKDLCRHEPRRKICSNIHCVHCERRRDYGRRITCV